MFRKIIRTITSGIYKDFLLSLIASAVTTVVAQIITYPLLAKKYGAYDYGRILTIMGVGNVIILTFGNSLNNVRLVTNSIYSERNLHGDFMPLLSILSFVGTLSFGVFLFYFGGLSLVTVLILCAFSLCGIIQSYGSVTFRIKIDYLKNLWLCCWIAVGNVIGLGFLLFSNDTHIWALTFFLGYLAGIVYLLFNSDVFTEPFRTTPLFSNTLGKELILVYTTLSANLLVYLDRLLLYPLLGGEAVSIYTVASFFGKSLAVLMNPICSVLLSYYSHQGFKMNRLVFWKINGITLSISAFFMFFCFFASEKITGLLYPSVIGQAKPYLLIANLAAVINVVGNMVSPAVLKFAAISWQAINQMVYMGIYLGAGIMMSRSSGLMGFSFAALIAAVARLVLFYIVGHFSLKKQTRL